mmetsp:Transcript_15928/g.38731  ORF Transcript_15928/g.38731 Transcript_15928/m.38731 type:complete len:200 (-) Transcript_15928:75-674(-)
MGALRPCAVAQGRTGPKHQPRQARTPSPLLRGILRLGVQLLAVLAPRRHERQPGATRNSRLENLQEFQSSVLVLIMSRRRESFETAARSWCRSEGVRGGQLRGWAGWHPQPSGCCGSVRTRAGFWCRHARQVVQYTRKVDFTPKSDTSECSETHVAASRELQYDSPEARPGVSRKVSPAPCQATGPRHIRQRRRLFGRR